MLHERYLELIMLKTLHTPIFVNLYAFSMRLNGV